MFMMSIMKVEGVGTVYGFKRKNATGGQTAN